MGGSLSSILGGAGASGAMAGGMGAMPFDALAAGTMGANVGGASAGAGGSSLLQKLIHGAAQGQLANTSGGGGRIAGGTMPQQDYMSQILSRLLSDHGSNGYNPPNAY